jgi:hypothetical protein
MPKLPDLREIAEVTIDDYEYDFLKAENILKAMDFLRGEAKKTRIPEIVTMIDATFKLLVTSYYCILRHEMMGLPEADDSPPPH